MQRHSGFAVFPSHERRRKFFETVVAGDPSLTDCAHVSQSRPTIIFENLTEGELKKLLSRIDEFGNWVEDVRFEPL